MRVEALSPELFHGERQRAQHLGYDIRPLLQLANDREFMGKLTEAHLQHYLKTHRVNPPAPRSLESWQRIFLGAIDPETAFVALCGEHIAAFASVRLAEDEGDAGNIFWFSVAPMFLEDTNLLNAALKFEELRAARQRGIKRLSFEIDSTDPGAEALLAQLTSERGEALLTYQNGIPSAPS